MGWCLFARLTYLLWRCLLCDVSGIKGEFSESSRKVLNKLLEATLWKVELLARKADFFYLFIGQCAQGQIALVHRGTPHVSSFLFPADLQCCQGGPLSSLPYSQQRLFRTFSGLPSSGGCPTLLPLVGERGRGQKGTPSSCPTETLHPVTAVGSLSSSGTLEMGRFSLTPGLLRAQLQLQVPLWWWSPRFPLLRVPRAGEANYHHLGAFQQQKLILPQI